MYHHLKGILTEVQPTFLVVECGGVGYMLKTSLSSSSQFKVGETALVYTHLQVREDALSLFGFATAQERDMFATLLEVSGVGSATAVCILSSLNPAQVAQAVLSEDEKRFVAVKGVGIKTAKRLILDLKDRISKSNWQSGGAPPKAAASDEAISALVALGFAKNLAEKQVNDLIKQSPNPLSTEEIIRKCLTG
jgi:Holliday junction DNA helicase RuvA